MNDDLKEKPVHPGPTASEAERAKYAQAMADWTAAGETDEGDQQKPAEDGQGGAVEG